MSFNEDNKSQYVAHVRKSDHKRQSVGKHLSDVSLIARRLTTKIGMKEAGELMSLMHYF